MGEPNLNSSGVDLKASTGELPGSAPGTPNQPRKKRLEDFLLGRVLGSGSYGDVMECTDKETGTQYAIKVLDKKHIIQQNKGKYVKTERDILSMCSHPFIVNLFYTFQTEASLYYVLELCSNGELLDNIKKHGSFDDTSSKFYSAELVCGLEFLHSKNIVHRDLKPENILLTNGMHLKITDFGTGKVLGGEKAMRGSFVGTAEYIAPELIVSKETCKASDLWALGCIIYQIVSGRPPFRGKTEYLTMEKVRTRDFSYPKNFPEVAKDLIEKLLVVNPDERLGASDGGYAKLKAHPFFTGINWTDMHLQSPPVVRPNPIKMIFPEDEEAEAQARQAELNTQWQRFLEKDENVLEVGFMVKRKGLSAKKRHFVLTDAPKLIYVDPKTNLKKGEIPLKTTFSLEIKSPSKFNIIVPGRTYILEIASEATQNSQKWADAITNATSKAKKH